MQVDKTNGVFGGTPPTIQRKKKTGFFGKILNKGNSAFKKALGYADKKGIGFCEQKLRIFKTSPNTFLLLYQLVLADTLYL